MRCDSGATRWSFIASDHGESLGDHGEPTHGVFLYGETADVPLIIAPPSGKSTGSLAPALAGHRVHGLARLVDVTPTVLDLTGVPAPRGLDGVSLLPMIVHETSTIGGRAASPMPPDFDDANEIAGPVSYAETYYPRFHYGWSELFSVATVRWRYVRAPRPELYDLIRDPKETRDVSAEYPQVVEALTSKLDGLSAAWRELASPGETRSRSRGEVALARLRQRQ